MKLQLLKHVKVATKFLERQSPVILTALAIGGVVVTTVMTVRATKDAIKDLEKEVDEYNCWQNFDKKQIISITWPRYIPVVISGTLTISCIFGAQYINAKRAAALATLYSVTENKLLTYQEKTKELLGERKADQIQNAVSEEEIKKNPLGRNEVIVTGRGNSLIYDAYSGRYFESDIEKIRQAANNLNQDLFSTMWISLNDFYQDLGLSPIKVGDDLGWNPDHMIDVIFDSQIAEDGRPCLVLDYQVGPRHDYRNLH